MIIIIKTTELKHYPPYCTVYRWWVEEGDKWGVVSKPELSVHVEVLDWG